MFTQQQLDSNPFLKKIMEAQAASGTKGLVTAGRPGAYRKGLSQKNIQATTAPAVIDPAKVPKKVKMEPENGKLSATAFAKTKPTRKQVKEYLEEKIARLSAIESSSDED